MARGAISVDTKSDLEIGQYLSGVVFEVVRVEISIEDNPSDTSCPVISYRHPMILCLSCSSLIRCARQGYGTLNNFGHDLP